MYNAKILSIGKYVPDNLVTNQDLEKQFGQTLNPKLENVIGIKERYLTTDKESTADLATKAAEIALNKAGIGANTLDMIIVTTDTPEYISPSTSAVVQGRIEAVNAGIFDMNASCTGFVMGLDVASRMIMTGGYNRILLVGVYNMSKYIDKSDIKAVPIFADGAGAVIIEATDHDTGFVSSQFLADGTQYDLLGIYAGGTKKPITKERIDNNEHLLQFLKRLPPDRNIKHWPPLIKDALKKAKLDLSQVNHFLFTQINKWAIEETMKSLGLSMDKTTCIMDRYGYTGSACIPMALDVALEEGRISKGDIVVLTASGVGFSMGSVVIKI